MSSLNENGAIRAEILDEAASWLVELRTAELSLAQRRRFDAWLRASPEHVRAYLAIVPTWEVGAKLDPSTQQDPLDLIRVMREADHNIVPLDGRAVLTENGAEPAKASQGQARREPAAGKGVLWRVGLPALAAAVGLIAFGAGYYGKQDVYSTGIGEQRFLTLTDGSIIEMNALSRVRLRFSKNERAVDLLEGQALFHVAHEPERPFIVLSGRTDIQAVGTEFDVYRKPDETTVTVLEGRVNVKNDDHGTELLSLSAGQQLEMTHEVIQPPVMANVQAATAWRQHRLIFSGTPLHEVAAEFNRYNRRRLTVEDAALGQLRINGIFSSSNPAALLDFLREQPDIAVVEDQRQIRITRK